MEPDVPRGVAHRARLFLRAEFPRLESCGGGEEVRAVFERRGRAQRPEPPVRGNAGRTDGGAHVRWRRRCAGRAESERRAAGCGLQGGERKVPVRTDLQRRELESATAGAANATGGRRKGGRLPARSERKRREGAGGSVQLL